MRLAVVFLAIEFLAIPAAGPARAGEEFVVRAADVVDRKAVVATVEPAHELVARARIGGTIAAMAIKEGDSVKAGETLAQVLDAKLALQMQALDARIASQQAQRDQSHTDYDRILELQKRAVATQSQLDQARTNLDIAERNLSAMKGDREVIVQQAAEGAVLAPGPGRVLTIPVSVGRVVLPGETIATIAEDQYILRLQLPERHARFLRAGDRVQIGSRGLDEEADGKAKEGIVRTVYPEIQGGRVVADVEMAGLGDYFVGERTRVYVDAGKRRAIFVPASYIYRRAGVNYARLSTGDEIVVQPGAAREDSGGGAVEILAGLHDGDRLSAP